MNWLRRLLGREPPLNAEQRLALIAHGVRQRVDGSASLVELRFIVTDVETTGLSPYTDRLISIGAIPLDHGSVRLGEGFDVVLRQPAASTAENILIHGIDGTTQLGGVDPAAGLLQFMDYIENAPLVGYHADFDRVMIDRACQSALGRTAGNPWLDLAFLAPALWGPQDRPRPLSLDDWLQRFGISNYARHNALADALATAQLLQMVLAEARARGITTLDALMKLERDQRWLGQH